MRKSSSLILVFILSFFACSPSASDENGDNPGSGTIQDRLDNTVLAYYTFDDGTASSTAGYALDGAFFGTPIFVTETASGKGKAVFLNGLKGQCVNIPYNLFKGYTNYSISIWLKDFSTGNIISSVATNDWYGNYPRLHYTADGKIAFQTASNYSKDIADLSFAYPCSSIQSGAWHHIVVTCASDVQKLYVDGSYVDSISKRWADVRNGVTKVQIGGDGDGMFSPAFSGMVDNVGIFEAALTAAEVKYLYDNKL